MAIIFFLFSPVRSFLRKRKHFFFFQISAKTLHNVYRENDSTLKKLSKTDPNKFIYLTFESGESDNIEFASTQSKEEKKNTQRNVLLIFIQNGHCLSVNLSVPQVKE